MPFRRRKAPTFREKLHRAIFPPKGFRRVLGYYRLKILRIGGSPHAVAAGLAIGMVSAWTPFLGFHILFAIPFAWVLGGSMVAAALGTAFANPVTCPIIWPLTWEIGQFILGRAGGGEARPVDLAALFSQLKLSELWDPILEPMLIGSLPPGLFCGLLVYVATYFGIRSFRNSQTERRLARRSEYQQAYEREYQPGNLTAQPANRKSVDA